MHPGINGPKLKDKPAIIMAGSGDVITHQELNELSNQGAQLFRSLGLKPGDSMAFMMENHKLFFPIAFAASYILISCLPALELLSLIYRRIRSRISSPSLRKGQ